MTRRGGNDHYDRGRAAEDRVVSLLSPHGTVERTDNGVCPDLYFTADGRRWGVEVKSTAGVLKSGDAGRILIGPGQYRKLDEAAKSTAILLLVEIRPLGGTKDTDYPYILVPWRVVKDVIGSPPPNQPFLTLWQIIRVGISLPVWLDMMVEPRH